MFNRRTAKWQSRMALKLDFNYMLNEYVGPRHGLSVEDLSGLSEIASRIHDDLKARREAGKIGFYNLPHDRATSAKIEAFAKKARRSFQNVVILGIGGSSLGPKALHSSLIGGMWANLATRRQRGGIPRFFFADNIDPDGFSRLLRAVDPSKTLFIVVTKSGTTAETMSQFLIVRRLLEKEVGRKKVSQHLVAVTDSQKGLLRIIAEREDLEDFIIPGNVGGRFSVFTPVGLLPAALMGIDLEELLDGAAYMDSRTSGADLMTNPAYVAGALLFLADKLRGRHITVMMSYSDSLYDIADWFRQLWAESLGKKNSLGGQEVFTGLTPVKALGVTDQHSQTQLYMEGPFDKSTVFLAVEKFAEQCPIPKLYGDLPDLAYLGGNSLADLFQAERLATEDAMLQAGRPSMTLTLPEVNPFTVGQLLYLLEVQTAFTGGLYNIDPFDQPGVELGKKLTYGLMGREGFESVRGELASRKARNAKFIL